MSFRPFQRQNIKEKELKTEDIQKLQNNLEDFTFQFNDRPQMDSRFLEDAALVSTQINLVEMGLGKEYQGYKILNMSAPAIIFEYTTGVDTTKYLGLVCSCDTTVNIEVF